MFFLARTQGRGKMSFCSPCKKNSASYRIGRYLLQLWKVENVVHPPFHDVTLRLFVLRLAGEGESNDRNFAACSVGGSTLTLNSET